MMSAKKHRHVPEPSVRREDSAIAGLCAVVVPLKRREGEIVSSIVVSYGRSSG